MVLPVGSNPAPPTTPEKPADNIIKVTLSDDKKQILVHMPMQGDANKHGHFIFVVTPEKTNQSIQTTKELFEKHINTDKSLIENIKAVAFKNTGWVKVGQAGPLPLYQYQSTHSFCLINADGTKMEFYQKTRSGISKTEEKIAEYHYVPVINKTAHECLDILPVNPANPEPNPSLLRVRRGPDEPLPNENEEEDDDLNPENLNPEINVRLLPNSP